MFDDWYVLGIVGSVEGVTYRQVREIADPWMLKYMDMSGDYSLERLVVASGGADGVDRHAERLAREWGVPCIVVKPAGQAWRFFKPRNLLVATVVDELLRIYSVDSKTYGSGWTADQAEKMGKLVERYPV